MSAPKGNVKKYFDIGPACIAATAVYSGSTTGWATGIADAASTAQSWLTALSQSDDDQGRVGQSIAIESLDVRVNVIPDNTIAGHNHLRMVIFSDQECDGTGPTFAEVLLKSTVATGIVQSFLNPSYFGRFKIIEDKHWTWYNSSTANSFQESTTPANQFWHDSHHDMKGHRVMWDTTNLSAIANARKGHIFMFFAHQVATVAAGGIITLVTTDPPGIQYTTRIRYTDS